MDELIQSAPTRKTFLVFDSNNGKIIHVHEVMALPGVSLPDNSELELEARTIANKIKGLALPSLGVLQVKREDMKPDVYYEVDVRNKTLLQKGKLELKTS